MAQVTDVKTVVLGLALWLTGMGGLMAAEVPQAGLAAEINGQWQQAIAIYRGVLAREPARAELWVRIADIHSRQGNSADALQALQQAVKAAPDNAAYWLRLSQAHASLEQRDAALAACRQAYRLQPDDAAILHSCAQQAGWAGDLKLAEQLYDRWLREEPGSNAALWGKARVATWADRLNAAAVIYEQLLAKDTRNAEAWLEYVQVEIWLGDFGAAADLLEHYRSQFGEDEAYRRKRARLLARAEWPVAAQAVNQPLLSANPRDYDLNYTRSLALRAGNRPAAARDSLAILQSLQADSKDTADMVRFVRTPLRSHVRAGISHYTDSDDIAIQRYSVDGRYVFGNLRTALLAGIDHERLRADTGSGLDTAAGEEHIHFRHGWLGMEHRISPRVLAEVRLGVARVAEADDLDSHFLALKLDPVDSLDLRIAHRQALYDVSPRSVSLAIEQRSNLLSASWRPDLRWFIDAQAGWSDYSDHNHKWQFLLAPRRAVIRRDHLQLDLGLSAERFGFDDNLDNGYYDPELYQRYAVNALAYWKFDDDNGISTTLSLGWHKDDSMSDYQFGEDLAVEAYRGIYEDWYLTLRTGYVERYNDTGGYDGWTLGASLMRRF